MEISAEVDNEEINAPLFFENNGFFIFDRVTGLLLQVPKSNYNHILDVFRNAHTKSSLRRSISEKIRNFEIKNPEFFEMLVELNSSVGAFLKKVPVHIKEFSKDKIYEYILREGLRELLLEVTTKCNLRCRYCVYSGIYNGYRSHSTEQMSFHVAMKAVDMYFDYLEKGSIYNPEREPAIGFYGGEPLLNFDLIKNVVNEVNYKYSKDYKINFTITTNGTLLKDTAIDFLLLNNFSICISLDGPREEHDRNRIYADGRGTFDIILGNIRRIEQRAEELGLDRKGIPMYAVVTYDVKTDLRKLWKFFDEESPIQPIFVTPVRPIDTNYYSQFSKEDYQEFHKISEELRDCFLDYVKNRKYLKGYSNFLESLYGVKVIAAYHRPLFVRIPFIYYTMSCIPGFKIFVDSKGTIHPCERSPSYITVGNIDSGLDLNLIEEVLLKYQKEALKECAQCYIAYNCPNCIALLGLKYHPQTCIRTREGFLENIKLAVQVYRENQEYLTTRSGIIGQLINFIDFR